MRFLALALVLPVLTPAIPAQTTPCHAEFNGPIFDTAVSTGAGMIAIKTQAANAFVAGRIEVFTGEASGMNTLAIWTHNATSNQPLTSLGQGTWSMSPVNSWQGANLNAAIPITAGTVFWVVWTPINGSQASVQAQSGPGAQTYRGSTNGGQTWTGPFLSHQWKFRIYCGNALAHYESFGSSCAGATRTLPTLGFNGAPSLGQPFDLLLERALASTTAILATGTSSSNWFALQLPLDLTPFGATGCTLLASGQILLPAATSATGTALVQFPVPNDFSLLNVSIFNQWWVIHPAANPLNLLFSNGGRGKIGN